jgi:hypothetical protein
MYLSRAGLLEMLTQNIDYFKSKPVNIPKITILLDHGYQERTPSTGVRENLSTDHEENQV